MSAEDVHKFFIVKIQLFFDNRFFCRRKRRIDNDE